MINPAQDQDEYYSTKEVADYFKCHIRTVRRWIAEGLLVTIKPSGKLLITRQSVQTLVRRSQQPIGGEF